MTPWEYITEDPDWQPVEDADGNLVGHTLAGVWVRVWRGGQVVDARYEPAP